MAKVLVVESKELGDIISYLLQEDGYEVVSLRNIFSTEAVMVLQPDVIILHNRNSKKMPGYMLAKALKNGRDTSTIPIILTSISPEIKKIAKEAGVDAYLSKPFDVRQLLSMVRSLSLKKK